MGRSETRHKQTLSKTTFADKPNDAVKGTNFFTDCIPVSTRRIPSISSIRSECPANLAIKSATGDALFHHPPCYPSETSSLTQFNLERGREKKLLPVLFSPMSHDRFDFLLH
ncbi:hypothetical protein TNCT_551451 [Trichonephila clavata]|uniref:Uncharacterized protein n=1 Tax=Trichonephila clavata TaxID=2740835 RepID=A0A8X6LXV6_TRICU|nr:hypothetical protein TNCT_551451 [Trichonephila clavata]